MNAPAVPRHTIPWWIEPFDDDWALSSLLERAAEHYGPNRAIHDGDGYVTHAEIARRSAHLRGAILDACPDGGRVVGCLSTLGPHWYAAVRAIFTSGLIYAALDPEAPDDRNQLCLDDCGADLIVADRSSIETARRLAGDRIPVVEIEQAEIDGMPRPAVEVSPDATAAYLFTSGSTGRPKAVIRSHRSYAHAAYAFGTTYEYRPDDVLLYPGSPAHVGTLNDAVTCLLCGHASIAVGTADFSVARVCDLLAAEGVTTTSFPPSLLRPVLQRLATTDAHALPLRQVMTSGAALQRVDISLFHEVLHPRAELWQNYGSTEAGPIIAAHYDAADADRAGGLPLRIPHPDCVVELVDADGVPVVDGEVGDVVIRSRYLADGYLVAPDDDHARFQSDERGRTYRIGDRGMRNEAGELILAGRNDRQISVHGRRFDLGEIEEAILRDPAWQAAVAVQVELQSGRLLLAALLEPAEPDAPDFTEVRARLADLLPAPFVPQRFHVVDTLPRTTTGKIDFRAAAELATATIVIEPTGLGGPPRGPAESWIADCWEHVLGITWPGRDESFTDLGGDSLAAIQLLLMLEQRFGVSLSLDRFAQAPTIADQVRLIERAEQGTNDPLVRLRTDGAGPLVVLIPGIGGHAWVYAELAHRLETVCDVVGVSLLDLSLEHETAVGPERIARLIVDLVQAEGADRPVVLGGFSFGGVVCCEVAAALEPTDVELDRILLMDPRPLDARTVTRRIRTWAKSMSQAVAPSNGAENRSPAAERLEAEVAAMNRLLSSTYPLPPTPLGTTAVSWLATRTGQADIAGRRDLLGRTPSTIDLVEFDCGHLDILRGSHVGRTAAWLDDQLDRD